jgi:hypothetical protein
MIDFREYAEKIKEIYQIEDAAFQEKLTHVLVDNEWFGIKPVLQDSILYVEPSEFQEVLPLIQQYFSSYDIDISDKNIKLMNQILVDKPETASKLQRFYEIYEFPSEVEYYLTSFFLKFLKKELFLYNDNEISQLLTIAFKELPKQYGDIITFFLTWLKEHYKTRYINDYAMTKRQDGASQNEAYDEDEYLQLLYCLFNEDYIMDKDMYRSAARSKNFIDTWLFLSLHFICALRNTDVVRIKHPRLTMDPEEVLSRVENDTFSEEDARITLYSITWRLAVLPLTPHKTKKHKNVPSIKLCFPESIEVLMGTLFAIAEAHRRLNHIPDDEPLVRVISDYDRITRYMGDEIGALFLESNFKTRAINKSYLQSVFMLTDDILENDDEFNVKGYILAALARSHKGSYGDFATTTVIYLKDAKMSGLTPEFVARELFERGVLSFIPSMLLKMITNLEYTKLPVHKQTELIRQLDLSPMEIEDIINTSERVKKRSMQVIKEIFAETDNTRDNILNILHRIGNGNAISKQNECLCLMSAMKRLCPYNDRTNCIGCEYEISTKSTVFLMVSEYNRLFKLYQDSTDKLLKNKYKTLLEEIVLPTMEELLHCVEEQYGTKAMTSLEKIIKENVL